MEAYRQSSMRIRMCLPVARVALRCYRPPLSPLTRPALQRCSASDRSRPLTACSEPFADCLLPRAVIIEVRRT